MTVASVVKLKQAWFAVCQSAELRATPRATMLQGVPLVLFRARDGKAATLADRCPHRSVPLSLGRVVNGELQCAYHGWRFDGAGVCQAVPGLAGGEVSLKSRCAEVYPTVEQDGFVWVWSDPTTPPVGAPYKFPFADDPRFTTVRRTLFAEATVHAVAENALDVPHTAFLHGGLFRNPEKKNEIEVVVRRTATMAEAEYLGEPAPKGLLGRILAPQGGTVQHWDRFLLPTIAQVEYRLGEKAHLFSTSALTPLSDHQTAVHAVVSFRLPVPHWLVRPFVTPVALRIFKQDAKILKAQTERIQQLGVERFTSTELDVLGHEILRLLRQAGGLEAPSTGTHEVRIKMRT